MSLVGKIVFYVIIFFLVGKKKKSKARKKRSYSVPTEVQKNQRGLQKEKTCLIIFDDKTEKCID